MPCLLTISQLLFWPHRGQRPSADPASRICRLPASRERDWRLAVTTGPRGRPEDGAMTQDAMISLLSAATRIACGQMTAQHLDALHASVERASSLSARHDW